MGDHDAFWAAIGAAPDDKLPRLVFADFLEDRAGMVDCERCGPPRMFPPYQWVCPTCDGTGRTSNGHAETAAALRATAKYVPLQDLPDGSFTWFRKWGWNELHGIHPESNLPPDLYAKLTGYDVMGTCRSYPTAADAIRDLCRAYVASRSKQEVPT